MNESQISQKMQQVLSRLVSETATIRTGRASPSLLENLQVAVYGGQQKLKILEIASITAPDPQTIVVSPWDKSIIGEIKKGIEAANIGMNPVIDGEIIRIAFPPLTTEDREKYVKLLSGKLEEARVEIRKVRAEAMHSIKRGYEDKEITEDEKFGQEKKLQELTDEFIQKIDEVGEKKKNELLSI